MAAIAVIVATLRAVEERPDPAIAALLLLLVVLVTATAANPRMTVGISVAAMLTFNFFLPPFQAPTIADPQNLIALLVFLPWP